MLSFLPMIAFSILLMAYGYIALFKKDLLWKIRGISAKVEGKSGEKRDSSTLANMNRMSNIMGTLSLILGAIGFFLTLAVMYIYFQTQAGVITV